MPEKKHSNKQATGTAAVSEAVKKKTELEPQAGSAETEIQPAAFLPKKEVTVSPGVNPSAPFTTAKPKMTLNLQGIKKGTSRTETKPALWHA